MIRLLYRPTLPSRTNRLLPGRVLLGLLCLPLLSCDRAKPSAPEDPLAIPWTPSSTIVCMGTSLTFGFGSGCKILPPRLDCQADSAYPALLQQRLRLPVVNLGIPLATSATGLQFLEKALEHDPALVLLEFGANDLFNHIPAAVVRANLAIMIEGFQGQGVRVGLLSFVHPEMTAHTPAGHRLADQMAEGLAYYAMLTELAAEYRLPIVDYLLEGIWWEPELMYDEVHPNGQGYLRMEENVFRGFQEIFAASGMLR